MLGRQPSLASLCERRRRRLALGEKAMYGAAERDQRLGETQSLRLTFLYRSTLTYGLCLSWVSIRVRIEDAQNPKPNRRRGVCPRRWRQSGSLWDRWPR